MKAALFDRYGGPEVIRIVDTAQPEPRKGEVLVRVHAASVNPIDWKIREGRFKFFSGRRFPKSLGSDFSGEIVKLGPGANYEVGDKIFGSVNPTEGRSGSYAEFLVISEERTAIKPAGMSHEEAAAIPLAGTSALQCLRDLGGLKAGQKILINGASGGVGTYAVQIGRIMDLQMVALCGASNLDFVKNLGAQQVYDYKKVSPLSLSEKFDVFFDVVPTASFKETRHLLTKRGVYITSNPSVPAIVASLGNPFRRQKARLLLLKKSSKDLGQIAAWISEKKMESCLGPTLTLAESREAHEVSESLRVRGKIIIRMS